MAPYEEQSDFDLEDDLDIDLEDDEDDLEDDLDLDIQEGLPIQRPRDLTTDEELEAIWIWIGMMARRLFEP